MADTFTPWTLFLILGLAFFFGLAYEEFHAGSKPKPPGGVRSFPLMALSGALLFAAEPSYGLLCAAGLLVLGSWLFGYYRVQLSLGDSETTSSTGLMTLVSSVIAYALGPTVLTQPAWVPVSVAVAVVLLMSAREPLHRAARTLPEGEVATLAKFLVIVGIILPLLPDQPVTELTTITPRQVWLAVVAISGLSYVSYLISYFVSPKRSGLIAGALGGLYSSTATTVALSRRMRSEPALANQTKAGIILATAMMYLRLGIVVAVFSPRLALALLPSLSVLFAVAAMTTLAFAYGRQEPTGETGEPSHRPSNPLQLGAAIVFALLFTAISIVSGVLETRFGNVGLFAFAALLGVTDVDPFVISIAQGSVEDAATPVLTAAILVAAASNNLLKAIYAIVFGGMIANRAVFIVLLLMSVATAFFAGLSLQGWL